MARIRIKNHDRKPLLSIAVAAATSLVVWYGWMLWTTTTPTLAVQRPISKIPSPYLCDSGYRFTAPLSDHSISCEQAGDDTRAWPCWSFQCSKHGAMVLQLRYAPDSSGRLHIRLVRVPREAWKDVKADIICPYCERALVPDISFRWIDEPSSSSTEHFSRPDSPTPSSDQPDSESP